MKIFKQESYAFFCNSIRTVQKNTPRFQKVVLYYKIIAACNMRYPSAVSGVIKHLGALKVYFSARKVHIFVSPFSYSTLLTGGIEKWNSGDTGEKMPSFVHECQTFPLQLRQNIFL
jgi:hypothetical protein